MRYDQSNDLLPTAFLTAIFFGFAAHLIFSEALVPSLIAACIGGLLGLMIAATSPDEQPARPDHRSHSPSPAHSRGGGSSWG